MATGILVETPTTFLSPHRSPEKYNITDFHLPVLVYRACLPSDPTATGISSFLEPNRWVQGPDSDAVNFLNNPPCHGLHQCLAVLKGYTRLLLGKEPFNPDASGGENAGMPALAIDLYERDVLVLPAGVLYHAVSDQGNYEHIIFHPKIEQDSAHFHGAEMQGSQTTLPDCDPIFGVDGPLVGIWKKAEEAWLKMAGL